MKNQNRVALLIFLVFTAIVVANTFFRSSDLKRNGIIVYGKILSYGFATKSSVMQFDYEFVYKGKVYKSDSPAGVTNSSEFIDKVFPVRYSPKTSRSEILITPRHFKRYGLEYPDSLEWVKKYLIDSI